MARGVGFVLPQTVTRVRQMNLWRHMVFMSKHVFARLSHSSDQSLQKYVTLLIIGHLWTTLIMLSLIVGV